MLNAQSYKSPQSLRDKKVFFITDFGYTFPINTIELSKYSKRGDVFNSELGLMFNLHSEFALGSTIHFAFSDGEPNYYIKLRFRKWLPGNMSVDFAPGFEVHNKKIMASLDFHFNKWFALAAQIEPVNTYDGLKYPISVGVKLSSKPGLITNIVVGTGALIVLSSVDWD
jgi:hypothetical protein